MDETQLTGTPVAGAKKPPVAAVAPPVAPPPVAPAASAAPAPAPVAASPTPSPPAAPTTAGDIVLKHLGQGGIGSDRVAAPPDEGSYWDLVPGTKHWNEPAQPGPQSWFDWFSKKYNPSPGDVATTFANGFDYGLSPLVTQEAQAAGATPPPEWTADAQRRRIQTASENVGPEGPFLTAAGMAVNPLTYAGGGMFGAGKLGWNAAEKFLPDAAEAAAKYLPENVAKWIPKSILPKSASAGAQTGTVAAANTAGQGGSPTDIAESFGKGFGFGALVPPVLEQFPGGPVSAQDITAKTTQAAQDAELAKAGLPISSKDLGFTVSGGPGAWGKGDPTLSQVNDLKDFLTSQEPGQGQDVLLNKINAQTSSPVVQKATKAADAAAKQAEWAKTLERWGSNEGLPGQTGDVRAQAAEEAQNHPPGSPENTALQNIARTPDPTDRVVSPNIRRALISGGALGGSTAESMLGLPHGGVYGVNAGNELANAIDWYFRPKGPGPAIQKEVNMGYPALTGQPGPTLGDAFRRLYRLP